LTTYCTVFACAMFRSASKARDEGRRGRSGAPSTIAFSVSCALLLLAGRWASAQTVAESFPLEPRTRAELAGIQDSWIDLLTAMQQGELEDADLEIESLLDATRALGMTGLPELANAAAVQAVEFARANDFEKAEAALRAAELLQPGEPEVAFAAMSVAWRDGRIFAAFGWWGKSIIRMIRSPVAARVVLANLLHWILVVLSLAALSFVGLLMAVRGSLLVQDLTVFMGHSLPPLAACILTAILMMWPILLPAGLLWLAIYWSVLLWGYGTRAERVVMVILWLFLGGLPIGVSEHVQRLDLGLSRPVRVVENVVAGRLTGSLFSDLGVIVDLLPESDAVKHLQADLHLRLRQWEMARTLYREVLARDGSNQASLADLGAVYFYEGDLANATLYLQQASAAPEVPAEVYFNLSRALSEQYRFAESEAMLQRASSLDSRRVGEWLSSVEASRVVTVSGGVAREDEILKEIGGAWRQGDVDPSLASLWRRTLSVPLALVLVGPAIGVYFLARKTRRRVSRHSEPWFDGMLERLRRTLLPGLPEAEEGSLLKTWVALVTVLGLCCLPFVGRYGFSVPLGYSPGLGSAWLLSAVVLAAYLLTRFLRADLRTAGRG